ncbi:hypothetical protein VNO78_12106 [Psophocarpus tetragonolobus]|uniref:Uncharacterized protein n=1 Tax=Psophocarpus tetragonolobus TaxID=3891 RepID=A0AAN9SMF2_PSOTE
MDRLWECLCCSIIVQIPMTAKQNKKKERKVEEKLCLYHPHPQPYLPPFRRHHRSTHGEAILGLELDEAPPKDDAMAPIGCVWVCKGANEVVENSGRFDAKLKSWWILPTSNPIAVTLDSFIRVTLTLSMIIWAFVYVGLLWRDEDFVKVALGKMNPHIAFMRLAKRREYYKEGTGHPMLDNMLR